MKQIKYLSFIPFLALLCLMTGCENDKDVYYPYVNVPLTTHNPVLVEGEVLHIGIGLDGVNYRVESDNEDVVTAEVVGNEILLTGSDIGSTIVRLSDDSYNRALMTVEVRKLQELTLESLPEGVEVLRLDNDGVILREMKILTGNGGYTVKSLNEGVATVAISGTTVTVTVVGDGGTTITGYRSILTTRRHVFIGMVIVPILTRPEFPVPDLMRRQKICTGINKTVK